VYNSNSTRKQQEPKSGQDSGWYVEGLILNRDKDNTKNNNTRKERKIVHISPTKSSDLFKKPIGTSNNRFTLNTESKEYLTPSQYQQLSDFSKRMTATATKKNRKVIKHCKTIL
jgi:hypothetical protein